MTTDEKLAAILAAVQTDPGNRGLARDPHDNLFTATAGDFRSACRVIVDHPAPRLGVVTGFFIPTANPPAFETDGPLGAVFLARAMRPLSLNVDVYCEERAHPAFRSVLRRKKGVYGHVWPIEPYRPLGTKPVLPMHRTTFLIALERAGPGADGRCYTMKGRDITGEMTPVQSWFDVEYQDASIGIGDGGNELGMGKVPHETVVKNIPNGDLIHCRVPTTHLIVAGVSNWGAYALAAGVYVLAEEPAPADLFDPDREREILEVMVREGPLVDGVTGKQTATVDGLSWDEYVKPMIRIREILES